MSRSVKCAVTRSPATATLVVLLVACCSSFAVSPRQGQAKLAKAIDAYLVQHVRNHDLSGVVIVRHDGREMRTYGMANRESNVPMASDANFYIASLTKTFTAGAILILVERGKIALDDPLSRYIPDFPRGAEITIRQLLLHRSGLPHSAEAPDPLRPSTLAESVERIKKLKLMHEPGAQGGYSSAGYTVLAYVVEQASRAPFDEFLQKEIFGPLKMTNTGDGSSIERVPGSARGYVPGPPPSGFLEAPPFQPTHFIGAASMHSTGDDLLKWLEAVRTERLFKLSKLEWPYGWGRRTYFDRLAYEQTGLVPGFSSVILTFPAERLDIVALLNTESPFFNFGAQDLAGIVFGVAPRPVPPRPEGARLPSGTLEAFAGRYQIEGGGPVFRVKLEGDCLFAAFGDPPDWRYVVPISATELYFPGPGARMTGRVKNGRIAAFDWKARDAAFTIVRTD